MESIKAVMMTVLKLAGAMDKATADGLGVDDIPLFIEPMSLLPNLTQAPEALEAFKSLTTEQRRELVAFVEAEFDLRDDNLEALIERGLALGVEVFVMVKEVRKLLRA